MKQVSAILYIMLELGADTTICLTEDIAVEAYNRCPEHFALPGHPEYPNIEAVRKRLQCEMTKGGMVTGSSKRGWLLTTHGLEVLEAEKGSVAQKQPKRKHHVSVERVTSSAGYRRYLVGEAPTVPELLESLGCNVNTEGKVVRSKMELWKTRANVLGDENLVNYLDQCERRVFRRESPP